MEVKGPPSVPQDFLGHFQKFGNSSSIQIYVAQILYTLIQNDWHTYTLQFSVAVNKTASLVSYVSY